MPEEFIQHLIYSIRYTWVLAVFFLMWPIAFGLGASALNMSPDKTDLGPGEALRRSVSSYLGFDKEAAVQRNRLILHRMVGALAWAYAVAIFIASIG